MLPNVLLIVKISSSRHFYYLCNWPFQLVSVLVLLILEFHTCPLVVLIVQWTLAFLKTFPFTVFFFFIGNILVHSSWTHCLFFVCLLSHLTDLLYQFFPSSTSLLIPEVHLTGKMLDWQGFSFLLYCYYKWVLYVNLCPLCSSGLRNALFVYCVLND